MKHIIAVVRDDGVVEGKGAYAPPVTERPSLLDRRSRRFALVGDFDVERHRPSGCRITSIEDLRHDFVAKIEGVAFDSWLIRRHEQFPS